MENECKQDKIYNIWEDKINRVYNKIIKSYESKDEEIDDELRILRYLVSNKTNEAASKIVQHIKFFEKENGKLDESIYDKLTQNQHYKIVDKIILPNLLSYGKTNIKDQSSIPEDIANSCLINNDKIVEFLIGNPDKIYWKYFSENPNNQAVKFLFNNQDKIDMEAFSRNSNDIVVKFLIENKDKINWRSFSANTNDMAVNFLINNKRKIDWEIFSSNPNNKAIEILEKNNNKVVLEKFYNNPTIKMDKIKNNNKFIKNREYFIMVLQTNYDYYEEKINAFNKCLKILFQRTPNFSI